MDKVSTQEMLEEAIKLEFGASDLYKLYGDYFPENKGFWLKLSEEEQNHAALLKTSEHFMEYNLPDAPALILKNLEGLKAANSRIEEIIAEFKESPPTESKACQVAVEFESSFQELHYQKKMIDDNKDSKISQVYKKLNHFDKNHEERIRQFMKDRNY